LAVWAQTLGCGTYNWLAPEMMMGKEITSKAKFLPPSLPPPARPRPFSPSPQGGVAT
jgi:hypothetical protein